MRALPIFVLVTVVTMATAQKGTQSEQRACYEQAKKFVEDNTSSDFPMMFMQAHYDPKNGTCYVQTQSTSAKGKDFIVASVYDAYEGKDVASCSYYSDGKSITNDDCYVAAEFAESRAEWNELLWKFIPAFKPINVK